MEWSRPFPTFPDEQFTQAKSGMAKIKTDKKDVITSGDKQDETTSATESEDKDHEGKIVIPSGEMEFPIIKLRVET